MDVATETFDRLGGAAHVGLDHLGVVLDVEQLPECRGTDQVAEQE